MEQPDNQAMGEIIRQMILQQAFQETVNLRADFEAMKARVAALEAASVQPSDEGWGG